MDSKHYFPHKLTEARKLQGKTVRDVADQLQVERQTIYRAEAGQSVSYELLAALCSIYGIPMNTIVAPFPEAATVNA